MNINSINTEKIKLKNVDELVKTLVKTMEKLSVNKKKMLIGKIFKENDKYL